MEATQTDFEMETCNSREAYSTFYLTTLVCLIMISITSSIFVLNVIFWFPDLYTSSKHVCQAFSMLSNIVATSTVGYLTLASVVPTPNTCSVSLVLTHTTMFTFISSDLLIHLDFYISIVVPFWHEWIIKANDFATPLLCIFFCSASVAGSIILYNMDHLRCPNYKDNIFVECPVVTIINLTTDRKITNLVNISVLSLFSFVFATSSHIFLIALKKIKANSAIGPVLQGSLQSSRTPEVEVPSAPDHMWAITRTCMQPPNNEGIHNRESNEDTIQPAHLRYSQGSKTASLRRAFTKSFRYILLNIVTYIFLIIPTLGKSLLSKTSIKVWGTMAPVFSGPDGMFLSPNAWKVSLLLFLTFRSTLPIFLIKSDKGLKEKINIIATDEIEE